MNKKNKINYQNKIKNLSFIKRKTKRINNQKILFSVPLTIKSDKLILLVEHLIKLINFMPLIIKHLIKTIIIKSHKLLKFLKISNLNLLLGKI